MRDRQKSGEECQSPVCAAGIGQSGDGEAAVITNLSGKVHPKSVNRVKLDPK